MNEQLRLDDEEISITLRRIWNHALRLLSTRVNKPTFEAHIRHLKPLAIEELREGGFFLHHITLGVPNAFTREWVEKRHAGLIQSVLEEVLDHRVMVQFRLTQKEETPATVPTERSTPTPRAPAPVPTPTLPPAPAPPTLFESEAELPSVVAPTRRAVRGSAALTALPMRTQLSHLQERMAQLPAEPTEFKLVAEEPPAPPAPKTPAPVTKPTPPAVRKNTSTDVALLNPRHTFESFIVGQSNRLAYAGALRVARTPGEINPLFIYGSPGLGKTHLMHAIGNELVQTTNLRVAHVSGESFTTHFITSLRERRSEEFSKRWRSVDVFLVDDVQFIAGKEKTKEEFFHTFDTLHQMGRQIVLCSDRSPRELRLMDERLRSRFEGGVIADIGPPDIETRLAILQRKAQMEQTRVPDEVLQYMANLIQSNIRALEGALVRLVMQASLSDSPITTELAATVLERYCIRAGAGSTPPLEAQPASEAPLSPAQKFTEAYVQQGGDPQNVNPEIIRKVVALHFGLTPDALAGKRRDKSVVTARQIAMHLIRELTQESLPIIGQYFGGRDHSTVAYACDRVRMQMPFDDDLRQMIEEITGKIHTQQFPVQ